MTTVNTNESKQDSAFKVFGFVSEQARRNLVIFFFILLISSNVFFIYQNIILTNKMQEQTQIYNDKLLDLSNKITEEVRKQIQPTQYRILQTTEKIDVLADKIDSELK